MPERTRSRELPLVFFTLALQLSSGLVLSATLCRAEARLTVDLDFKPLPIAAFAVAALALLASVLHLGRPLSAWRSLTNLRNSRLSLEILLTGMYVASSAALAWTWGPPQSLWLPALTSILGVAAVVASATVYMLPAQPAWNASWVLISFLGTMLTLGGAGSVAFLMSVTTNVPFMSPLLMMLLGAALVITSGAGLHRSSRHIAHTVKILTGPHPQLAPGQRWLLALHVVLLGILPFAVAAQMTLSSIGLGPSSTLLAFAVLTGAISGGLLGRTLMFSLAKGAF